jgi:ubiquinone/menaquinone biosynthesis C-methylase UbiE
MNIEWRIIDAQGLPFDNNSVDLVVCCFGYMFLADKLSGYKEAYRILRPKGMLIFATWDSLDSNGSSFVYRNIAKEYLAEPLPESYNLPFSMNNENQIRTTLQAAGFSKINVEKIQKQCVSKTAKEAAEGLSRGGTIYNEIMSRNPAWVEEIQSKVEKELTEKFGAAPMVAPMSALISQAWK